MQRNAHFAALTEYYLFPQVLARKAKFLQLNPEIDLIDLGIGDTRLPIPECAARAMAARAMELASAQGYRGYGNEQGEGELRACIAEHHYRGQIDPDEIFIGDGTKCDLARLQVLLGPEAILGVQDPTYPAYRDGAILTHGLRRADGTVRVRPLPPAPGMGGLPDLQKIDPDLDALVICSPNNPTGEAATRAHLTTLVAWARTHGVLIAFDAAYSWYVRDADVPSSIFEIDGATHCALEFNSFSKMAGFTGIRLSWTTLPRALTLPDKSELLRDWRRAATTLFNGASNIAQAGGAACLTPEGSQEVRQRTDHYMANAAELRNALMQRGIACSGGINAPYLWVHFPGMTSWDAFDMLLNKFHLVTTPGSGFGDGGEGYVRISAFATRNDAARAAQRLREGQMGESALR